MFKYTHTHLSLSLCIVLTFGLLTVTAYEVARARPDTTDNTIILEGEIQPGSDIMVAGLPRQGYRCNTVYWQRGRPEYQNRIDVQEFSVNVTGAYRILVSNRARDLTPQELEEIPEDEWENARPRPYVMLYRRRFEIDQPTTRCMWAGQDQRLAAIPTWFEAGQTYFIVISYEGDEPEWSFTYHIFIELIGDGGYHFCVSENDPACAETPPN